MAEVVKVPVELTGLQKLNSQLIQQMNTTYRTLFADMQKAQTQLNQVIESGVRAQFPETGKARGRGKFKVTTPVQMSVAADLAAGLGPSANETLFTSVVDFDKENRELIRKKQHLLRQKRRTGSLGAFDRAIENQVKFVKEVQDSFKEKLIPESVVQAAEKELKTLRDRREKFAAFMQKGQSRDIVRRTTETYKKQIERIRSMFSEDALGLFNQANRLKSIADAVTKSEEKGKVSPEFARRVRREARSVQKKWETAKAKDAQIASREDDQIAAEERRQRKETQARSAKEAKRIIADAVDRDKQTAKEAKQIMSEAVAADKAEAARKRKEAVRLREADAGFMQDRDEVFKQNRRTADKLKKDVDKAKTKTKQQTRDAERERQRNMSQATMGMASVGIGLLGNAGFPLLNVAFASMSGMKYAGMAAVATAMGEAVRGVMRLQDAAMASADSLGFLSKGFKEARAQMEASKAFYGGLYAISQERMYRERNAAMQNNPAISAPWMFAGAARTRISNLPFNINMGNIAAMQGRGLGGNVAALGGNIVRDTLGDIRQSPGDLRESYESMRRQIGGYSASIESPEAMWRRIQSASASPMEESRRLALAQLEQMKKNIVAQEKFAASVDKLVTWIGNIGAGGYR